MIPVWIVQINSDEAEVFSDEPLYAPIGGGCYEWEGESLMVVYLKILPKTLQRRFKLRKQPFQVNMNITLKKDNTK